MWKHELKLSIVCFFVALACLGAPAANQNDPLVTLKLENAPLRLALQNISRQTGVTFVYGDAWLEGTVISCDLEHIPLERALEVLLMNTGLSYERVKAKRIIIYKKGALRHFSVAGLVVDAQTGETLPYANIRLQRSRLGASADREGRFSLPNLAAPCTLQAPHVGYFPQTLAVDSSTSALRIALRQKALRLQGLVVKAENWDLVQVSEVASHLAISPAAFSNLPSAGEKDISRSLQLLPGINTVNYGASGVHIRGGVPSQNLVLLDGMMLYNSDHAFGLFSAVNSDAIKDVRVYKGGFPAKFGGRLSGVMEVTAKSGDFHRPRLSLGMNQLEAHGVLEIPLAGKGAVLLSGRRPFSENVPGGLYERVVDALFTNATSVQYDLNKVEIAEVLSRSGVRFFDLLGKLTWMPGKKDILALSFYSGRDKSKSHETFRVSFFADSLGSVVDSARVEEQAKWGNRGYSGKWHRAWYDDLSSTAMITYSDYSSEHEVLHSSSITRNDAAFPSPGGFKFSALPLGLQATNHVKETTFRLDNSWKLPQHHALEFGAAVTLTKIALKDEGYSIRVNNLLALNAFQQQEKSRLLSLYAQDEWTPLPKLRMTAGLRVNRYSLENKVNWEPRFSLGYPVSQHLTVKGAWGRYYQYVMQYGNNFQDLY
ncbi:MAG: TonB-dependent receptor domain-containing protein [bacterium]